MLQLFLVLFFYIIITQPLGLFSDYAEDTVQDIELHLYYQELSKLPENFDFSEITTQYATRDDFINSVEYVGLDNVYGKYSVDQLSSRIMRLELYYRLLALVSFFLLYGMYELIIMSYYRRVIRPNSKNIQKENKVRNIVNTILHPIEHQRNKSVAEE